METGTNITLTLELSVEELCTIYSALTGRLVAPNEIACAKRMAKQLAQELHCDER